MIVVLQTMGRINLHNDILVKHPVINLILGICKNQLYSILFTTINDLKNDNGGVFYALALKQFGRLHMPTSKNTSSWKLL